MTANPSRRKAPGWTIYQAMILAGACLMAGVAAGWFLRIGQSSRASAAVAAATASPQGTDPARHKQRADADAAPLLVRLQSDAQNPDLLTSLGNIYYDAQQYATAVAYYGRALQARPSDAAVRTDMGTASWYLGHADDAIASFDRALADQPDNPNTLFNRGIVEWQGKRDIPAALADWRHLLAANPGYPDRDKVQHMLAELEQQTSAASAVQPR